MADVDGQGGPSPESWLAVRRTLSAHRRELGSAAARLYGGASRVAGTELLARPEWVPAAPVGLNGVPLGWQPQPPPPAIDPAGPLTAHVRPCQPGRADRRQYATYAEAVGGLDRPALYENRPCYRLLAARLAVRPGLTFGQCRYFDGVSLGHAVAHELAAASLDGCGPVAMAGLPLRAAAGDPCDLARRNATVAVTTLTLRRETGGGASFILHWRDPARVNHGGGLYQVMPAGMFQPVTGTPAGLRGDLSLWRCMAREFSEELLGTAEDYPTSGGVLDYQDWPFYRALAAARGAGTLGVWCLGIGVDALTLATDILTVAVFDGDVFDALFSGLVAGNAEGRLVTAGGSAAIPFTEATVARFTGGAEPMQAAGAALLRLAWEHRRHLLG
ncbi:MAG: transcriptional regulator [Actinobacteria bacterium]|nr:transcriptional regulator [Actinomycetota bacterium]